MQIRMLVAETWLAHPLHQSGTAVTSSHREEHVGLPRVGPSSRSAGAEWGRDLANQVETYSSGIAPVQTISKLSR